MALERRAAGQRFALDEGHRLQPRRRAARHGFESCLRPFADDIGDGPVLARGAGRAALERIARQDADMAGEFGLGHRRIAARSEEHTSELQSLMRISYAVFCLKKKKTTRHTPNP